jgi:outer membrane protein assembly factor BamB
MIRRPTAVWLGAACLVWWGAVACAEDWPGWRGPDRSGVSAEKGLLKEWPKDGPDRLWKASGLGTGYSSPAVVGDRVYVLGSKGNSSEYLFVLDLKDGKEIARIEIGSQARGGPGGGGGGGGRPGGGGFGGFPGPRSSPAVDGDLVYGLSSGGDLACVQIKAGDKDGKVLWSKNLRKDFDGRESMWHYSESPLLDGDAVICTPGGSKATMVALDKKSGEVIWKSDISGAGEASYASPIVAKVGDVKQYVQFLGSGVVGVSAKDGKLLWRYDKNSSMANCTTPVFYDGYVFTSSGGSGGGFGGGGFGGPGGGGPGGGFGGRGGGGGAALVELKADGDKVEAKEVYKNKDLLCYHGGVVRVGDYLYGTNGNRLVCMDFKTGDKKWDNRAVGAASIVAADGMLYVRGEGGDVALVEATPDGYKEKGRFEVPGGGRNQSFPHPVIADGKLFIHEGDTLFCYDVKGK